MITSNDCPFGWILRASDRDISLRFRSVRTQTYANYLSQVFMDTGDFSSLVSNPVMQSISRLFVIVFILVIRADTGDLLVASDVFRYNNYVSVGDPGFSTGGSAPTQKGDLRQPKRGICTNPKGGSAPTQKGDLHQPKRGISTNPKGGSPPTQKGDLHQPKRGISTNPKGGSPPTQKGISTNPKGG